ncbi:Transcription repressor OFP12-like protein [Drosera capensis]
MPNLFGKNLHKCFTSIQQPQQTEIPIRDNPTRPSAATTATSFSFSAFFKNYNTLYEFNAGHSEDQSPSSSSTIANHDDIPDPEPMLILDNDTTPDMAALYASQRFFFSSPGHSSSIIDSSPSSLSSCSLDRLPSSSPLPDSIPVQTYSPDPYSDFRLSMQEMVEARDRHEEEWSWEYLNELLVCYLKLNPESAHGDIVRAFADLVVCLVAAAGGGSWSGGGGDGFDCD